MSIPRELVVGDSWSWRTDYADYPAGTWTATAYLGSSSAQITVPSTADGTTHVFSLSAAQTSLLSAGRYYARVRVVSGSDAYTVEAQWVDILPDPASQVLVDHRSWARRTLDAIEAFLEGNATTAQQSMQIAGRAISRYSLLELTAWRDKLRAQVALEEAGAQAGLGRDIRIRYAPP